MPIVTIQLRNIPLNHSLQVGDTLYYVSTTSVGNIWDIQAPGNEIKLLGPVLEIIDLPMGQNDRPEVAETKVWGTNYDLVVDVDLSITTMVTPGDFLMFSKDNVANMSSILGYYAEVTFKNNSKEYVELFSVGSEITESSS